MHNVQVLLEQPYGEVLAKQKGKDGGNVLHAAAKANKCLLIELILNQDYGFELAFQEDNRGNEPFFYCDNFRDLRGRQTFLRLGGKSIAETAFLHFMYPYTRAAFIADPNRHKLLMKSDAGLDVLFNDLKIKHNFPEQLYLYALAFEGYAREKSVFKDLEKVPHLQRLKILLEIFDKQLHEPAEDAAQDDNALQATSKKLIEALQTCQTIINSASLTNLSAPSWAPTMLKSRFKNIFDEIPVEIKRNLGRLSSPRL
jgi:hypothetical protein